MSHTLNIIFTCDNCGAQAEDDRLRTPEGWSVYVPGGFDGPLGALVNRGRDRCPFCVQAVREAEEAALAGRRDFMRELFGGKA